MAWSIFQQGGGDGAAVTWAKNLLALIGAPQSPGNVQVVYDWERSEGSGGQYNPLNQGPTPGHPDWSGGSQYGGGASDYTSWQTGLQGAASYLNMSSYAGIRTALVNNNPQQARANIISSPWAASHYSGGSAFSSAPLPGQATALGPGGTVQQTGVTSDLAGAAAGGLLSGLTGGFGTDVVDLVERGALILFGGILVIMGLLRFTGTDKAVVKLAEEGVTRGQSKSSAE